MVGMFVWNDVYMFFILNFNLSFKLILSQGHNIHIFSTPCQCWKHLNQTLLFMSKRYDFGSILNCVFERIAVMYI